MQIQGKVLTEPKHYTYKDKNDGSERSILKFKFGFMDQVGTRTSNVKMGVTLWNDQASEHRDKIKIDDFLYMVGLLGWEMWKNKEGKEIWSLKFSPGEDEKIEFPPQTIREGDTDPVPTAIPEERNKIEVDNRFEEDDIPF